MSLPIVIKAADALSQYGIKALINTHVVFVNEVLGNGDVTMKAGVIIDDLYYIIDDPRWEKAVLFVEVTENDNNTLHAIFAHEQLALMQAPNPLRRATDKVGGDV